MYLLFCECVAGLKCNNGCLLIKTLSKLSTENIEYDS